MLGLIWAILLPIMMMGLYTMVFGFIFGSSYQVIPDETKVDFGLGIFLSLSLFGLVSDSFAMAPGNSPELPKFCPQSGLSSRDFASRKFWCFDGQFWYQLYAFSRRTNLYWPGLSD